MSTNAATMPLSPQQQRVVDVGGWTPAAPFAARCRIRVVGALDVEIMLRVLGRLSTRHEVLRSVLTETARGALAQETLERPIVPAYDQTGPAAVETSAQSGNAARILLSRVGADEHELHLRFPTACCDRASLENLVTDVAEMYHAERTHAPLVNDALPYAHAVAWLNETLASADAEPGRAFWRRHGSPPAPRLPFERHGVAASFEPAVVDGGRVAHVGVSPEQVDAQVVAAWWHLLQRLTENEHVPMAVVHDGRQYPELRTAVGLYERTLPLGHGPASDVTVGDAVAAARTAVTVVSTWADAFQADTLPGPQPLSMPFVVEVRTASAPRRLDGLTYHIVECEAYTEPFSLRLTCTRLDDAVVLAIHYDTARYREQDVRELLEHLRALLTHAVEVPHAPFRSLPLTTTAAAWPPPSAAAPGQARLECVHHAFEAAARRAPDRLAVTCEDESLTFGALNARANQVAHRLQRLGVHPNTAVGLLLDRSVDLVVGLLGILKAGTGYVALDPQLPASRLALMTDAANATFVVTNRAVHAARSVGRAVLIDDVDDPLDREPATDPAERSTLAHLAYVLFTSGSTGQPKGVAVEHGNLAAYVAAVRARLDLPDAASYATVTTLAADLGNTAVFPALTSGGHLHVVHEDRATDAERFAEYNARHRIQVLKIVPSHLRALLSASAPERVLPSARLVLGGEACPWDLVALVRSLAPGCRIFNHYGPTETTIGATTFEVTSDRGPLDGPTVPIGWALDHARTYVLDEARRPVPRWFSGELYIGGPAVTRGYVNAPAGVDSPFMADPFDGTGGRMYRTGDRVRQRANGEIEFLGRVDDQVKIRGFRIEPGEVAAVLRQHPGIDDATVVVSRGEGGQATLVGAVATQSDAIDERMLKAHLRARLLEAMVPSTIAIVATLPRTSNGKIDRAAIERLALQPPARAAAPTAGATAGATPGAASSVPPRAPTSGAEQTISEIWRELLALDDVSPTDNFYDLGGHSLLAINVVTAIEKRLGVKIVPRDLVFNTLRQIAARCDAAQGAQHAQS